MSVAIIGVGTGSEPSARAMTLIQRAGLLIGGTRQLSMYQSESPNAQKWDVKGRLKEIVPTISNARKDRIDVVVLASGDPMFFGIGSYLFDRLKQAGITAEVISAPSSIAVAASRFGIKWSDAHVISVHGRSIPDIPFLLQQHGKLAILTDAHNNPARIGSIISDAGIVNGTAYVAEDLGSTSEKTRSVPLRELSTLDDVSSLNVLFLVSPRKHIPAIPFDPEDAFAKKVPKKGLITKREIRALSIAALGVGSGDICWDLGAGSGAVSIDMARCGAKSVLAVEKNADGCEIIKGNVRRFGSTQVQVIHSKAPEGLEDLPDPDRVFIGGSGGNMALLIEIIFQRMKPKGTLVINVATVENLVEAIQALRNQHADFECIQVQVSRSKTILKRLTRFEGLNPITIIRAQASEEKDDD